MRYAHGQNRQLPQILSILAVSLAAISDGALFAWTSPSIPQIIKDNTTHITFEESSYFTILPPIGMAVTAPLFPLAFNKIGRQKAVVLIGVPHIIAWLLNGLANNIWLFYLGRLIVGIAGAATTSIIPIYIGEISEPFVRGTWGNVFATAMFFGIFLVNVVGSYTSIKITALICGSISLLYVVACIFVPESPYFLLKKGKEEEAKRSMRKLRWRVDVEEEFELIKRNIRKEVCETVTIKDLFKNDSNRRAVFICIGVRLAQQYSGLQAFLSYTQYMFEEAGGELSAEISSIIYTGFYLLCSSVNSLLVDKLGRRPLLIFSSVGCAVVLTIEFIYFYLKQFTQTDLSYLSWFPLAGMIGYIILSSSGLAILPSLMLGELLPTNIKSKAAMLVILVQGINAIVGPKLFQTLTYNFGLYASFLFFSCCTFTSAILLYLYVIETKGKTLEEIQDLLSHTIKKEKESRSVS